MAFSFSVLKGRSEKVECCPHAGRFGVPWSSQAATSQAGLCRQHGTCGFCSLSTWHAGHGHHAQRRRHAAGACFVFGVCCGGVQVADVRMYACGAACFACCGVLQRRHNFDAFLTRAGKRQPKELVRHWIRTATRDNLSDDSLCGHSRVPPAFHTTARELQTCAFQGPGASNTTKIPREDPPRERRKNENCGGRKKKSAKFWALPTFGPQPLGPHTLGPHFFWVWAPAFLIFSFSCFFFCAFFVSISCHFLLIF